LILLEVIRFFVFVNGGSMTNAKVSGVPRWQKG